ncbi:MAG: hypothetical protein ACK53L_02680, partial [Pirellulaceae bacterium]
ARSANVMLIEPPVASPFEYLDRSMYYAIGSLVARHHRLISVAEQALGSLASAVGSRARASAGAFPLSRYSPPG